MFKKGFTLDSKWLVDNNPLETYGSCLLRIIIDFLR